ncbi:MAG: alpha-amylase family protein, partial [Candidatus Acetothermia bacterium]|nr:alpha-amylase family protein [Candidatus Acetothermia bacterium]
MPPAWEARKLAKQGELTRREFLKGAGAAALGLALSDILPRKALSQAAGCPPYRGIAPVDFDYTYDTYAQMRPHHERWLEEIKAVGADSVEIMIPIKRGPDYQVGYNHYGTPQWLPMDRDQGTALNMNIKDFVRRAQSKGFKVILDIPSMCPSEEPRPQPFDLDLFYSNLETMA